MTTALIALAATVAVVLLLAWAVWVSTNMGKR